METEPPENIIIKIRQLFFCPVFLPENAGINQAGMVLHLIIVML